MQNIIDNYKDRLGQLTGLQCSGVAGTAGVGSMITLMFGTSFTRIISCVREPFSYEDSDTALCLEFAAWRLRRGEESLCSSSTPNGPGSKMETSLSNLKGLTVIGVDLNEGSFDLAITFSNEFVFSIFCDQFDTGNENYSFRCKGERFTVGCGPKLMLEAEK